jgi:hypothetical protein
MAEPLGRSLRKLCDKKYSTETANIGERVRMVVTVDQAKWVILRAPKQLL